MEMRQLLNVPTGSEPVAELFNKLEALKMMLKGFRGEIAEDIEALDLLSTLHDFTSDAFVQSADPFVRISTGNCIIHILKFSMPRLQCISSFDLQKLQIFLVSNITLLENPDAAWFEMSLDYVHSLLTNKTLCIVRFTENLEFIVNWCRNLFSIVFRMVTKTTAFARRQLQQLLQTVVNDVVQVDDVEPVLDVIYVQILDQIDNPITHEFIVNLLQACCRDLELPTQQFFINHLQSKPCYSYLRIISRKFELMKILYCACPQLVALSLGGLQSCLEASVLNESSLDLVIALSKMFAVADLNLAHDCKHLWYSFLRRLRHADKKVKLLGLKEINNIICSHPELIQTSWKYFMQHCAKERNVDVVEKVFECLEAVCSDLSVCHIDIVMQMIKDLVVDPSVIVRERTLKILAGILAKVLFSPMNIQMRQKCNEILWIIFNYYKLGDNRARSFTQTLIARYLIPYELSVEERVLQLLIVWLFMSEDMRAVFHDAQRNSFFFRMQVQETLKLCSECSNQQTKSLLRTHVLWISEKLDRPDSQQDYLALAEMFGHYHRNRSYLEKLKIIADPVNYSISDRIASVNELLNNVKIKNPDMYPVVEQLCARLALDYFDKKGFSVLLQWIHHCVLNEKTPFRIFCTPHELATEGSKLMFEVLFSSPHLAFTTLSVTRLMEIIQATSSSGATYATWILKVMTVMAIHDSFKNVYPVLFNEHILPLLKKYVVSGTAKESKFAVQALASHLRTDRLPTLQHLMKEVFEKAKLQDEHYVPLITAAAYLNAYMPWDVVTSFRKIVPLFLQVIFNSQLLGNLVYTKETIVRIKEALANGNVALPKQLCVNRILNNLDLPNGNFYDRNMIPESTECLMAAIKTASGLIATMAHWEQDKGKSQKIQRAHCELLTLICLNEMHSSLEGPLRYEDKACLRLAAGTAMLRLCIWPAFWDIVPVESFVALSHLMTDGVKQVRLKLCRKLARELSTEASGLPVDFLAFFIVALFEEDKDRCDEIKGMLKVAIKTKRVAYRHSIYIANECNNFDELVEKKPELLVENSLVVAIFLLAHNPLFYSTTEAPVLYKVENSLTVLLTELQEGTDRLSIEACTALVTRLQSLRSSLTSESDYVHDKILLLCGLVLKQFETVKKLRRKHQREVPISLKYFQDHGISAQT